MIDSKKQLNTAELEIGYNGFKITSNVEDSSQNNVTCEIFIQLIGKKYYTKAFCGEKLYCSGLCNEKMDVIGLLPGLTYNIKINPNIEYNNKIILSKTLSK